MATLGCGQVLDVAGSAPGDAAAYAAQSPSSADGDIDIDAPWPSDGGARVASDAGPESAASDSATSQGAVDPAVSGQWSWQKCGSIAPTPLATQAQFLPSGELVVSYVDGSILVHSASTWRPARQLVAMGGTPATFGVSLDGTLLATAAAQSLEVVILNTADGSNVLAFPQPPECASGALQFSAEGDDVFETGGDSTCIWRTADGSLIAEMPGALTSAAIRMGQLVAVDNGASQDSTSQPALVTYTLPATACGAFCPPPVQGSTVPLEVPLGGAARPSMLRVSPRGDSVAGELVANGSWGSALWNSDGSLAYSSFSHPAYSTVYSPAGERVLLTDRVVNVASSAVESVLTDEGVSTYPTAIDSSGRLAANSPSGLVSLFELPSGEPLDVLGAVPIPSEPATLLQPSDIAASADGTHLLVGIMMWRIDPDFGQSNIIAAEPSGIRLDDAFSPDGTEYVISGDLFNGIESTNTGAHLEQPGPPAPNVPPAGCFATGARLSPHNDWFLVGAYDAVNVLSISDNTQIARLPTARCDARAVFNADETLVVTTDPALYRVSDWSAVWNSANADDARSAGGFWDDVQIRPNANEILVSHCETGSCLHALYSLTDGSMLRSLPELTGNRAKFSPEGNWVVSGTTLLHLPDGQERVLDPGAALAAFAPNGDIIALLADNTLARYCRGQ